ncbi:MAG TPA: prolyl oligopeptidase family serine peptidase [Dictyobacter sp.]|jgi:dipeptidyl aminopeptidase/acylaminoacyl peptidase|nr:prolyl oligopeptidase family serine peptidase [Dictyobacter sp.]
MNMFENEGSTKQRPTSFDPDTNNDPRSTAQTQSVSKQDETSPMSEATATVTTITDNNAASQETEQTPDDIPATTPQPVPSPIQTAQKQAQSQQPGTAPVLPYMDVDDLLSLQIASDPQISPDGSQIAFTLQQSHTQQNIATSAIWLVSSLDGKTAQPRKATSGASNDTTPRWSPDGQTLAFLSDRNGPPQIFLISLQGGEAQQITFLPQGVTEYSWSPDGQRLLAHSAWKQSDDQPGANANDQIAIVMTRLSDLESGRSLEHGRHQQLWLITLDGQVQRLTAEPVDLNQSCWSPNGQEIAFCANRRPDPDLSLGRALWVLTLATGQMRRLTPEDGTAYMPSWSPDGNTIAYLYTADQTEAANVTPWLVNAQGQPQPRLAVPGAEQITCQAWIIDELRTEFMIPPIWFADNQALLVPVQERGQVHLYRLDLAQQTLQRLTNGNGRYISPQLSRNGQMIAMVRADWFTPGDIWRMDTTGKQPRRLTGVNDTLLQSHQLIRPKRITWQSIDGMKIEGFLYLPPLHAQTRAPLITIVHGGPSLAWGDGYVHEFQVMAGNGYAVFAPNPRGSSGYGEDFCRRVVNDWGGTDFQDIMTGIDFILQTEAVDGERLGITGSSYGGYMTNWAVTHTDRFKAAVSRNGITSLSQDALQSVQSVWMSISMEDEARRQERSPLNYVDQVKTPLLILHAEDDIDCPLSSVVQFFVALRKRKHPVELVRYPNTSHLIDWPGVGTPQQRIDRHHRTLQWFANLL